MEDTLKRLEAAWSKHDPAELPSRMPVDTLTVLPELFQPRKTEEHGSKRPTRSARDAGVVFSEHVAKLAMHLGERGTDLDPILALRVGEQNIVIDGHHRRAAYIQKGRHDIPVQWFPGSPMAAYIEAGRQNFKDVAQSSEATKSQRAWDMVCSTLPWTREQIMTASAASRSNVGNMRRAFKEYKQRGEEPPGLWVDARRALRKELGNDDREREPRVSHNVTEWAKRLREGFPKLDTLGKAHMFAEALQKFSPRRAADIALWLVDELGLHEAVAARHEQITSELEHAYDLDD